MMDVDVVDWVLCEGDEIVKCVLLDVEMGWDVKMGDVGVSLWLNLFVVMEIM